MKKADRAEAAVPFDRSLVRVLDELLSTERVLFFPKCVRKRLCVKKVVAPDVDVQMMFFMPK